MDISLVSPPQNKGVFRCRIELGERALLEYVSPCSEEHGDNIDYVLWDLMLVSKLLSLVSFSYWN